MPHIELIIGPMFSGKTTELLRRGKRFELAGYKCLYIKWEGDVRYSVNQVMSHDLNGINAINVLTIKDILNDESFRKFDILLVDEAQFIHDLDLLCTTHFKKCVVAGLDADFNMEAFRGVTDLIAKAELVDKLSAICKCGANAYFTKLIVDKPVEGNKLLGSKESYTSCCRSCYMS